MNDARDQLVRAQLAAFAGGGHDGDWGDVVSRARRAQRRRVLGLAGIASLVVVGVASAVALTRPTVDFDSAEKGSDAVIVDFGKSKVIAKLGGVSLGTLPEEARRITTVTIDGKAHVLSVAPTEAGGFCWIWSEASGSCRSTRERPERIGYGGLGGPYGFSTLSGTFLFETGTRLVAGYSDGTETDVPFVWVTEPIAAGFFMFDVAASAGHKIVSLTLYDEDGNALATEQVPDMSGDAIPYQTHRVPGFGLLAASPKAIYAKRELLFDIEVGPHRHLGLWIAPSTDGGTCHWTTTGSGCDNAGESWPVPPDFAKKHPELAEAGPLLGLGTHGGNPVSLCCRLDDTVARVELRYEDGDRQTATPKKGYLLVVLPAEHYPLGHRLKEMVAYDAAGNVVGTRRFVPDEMGAVYPCETPKDLGYGVKACP